MWGKDQSGVWKAPSRNQLRIQVLFFLKACKAGRLHQSQRLQCLDLLPNFWGEPINEATQEEQRKKPYNPICQILKIRQVLCYWPFLCEYEKSPNGILILRGHKSNLESLEKHQPWGELTIVGHPLKPGKDTAFHIKRNNRETIMLWSTMILEKLVDLKDPTKRISAIESWDI